MANMVPTRADDVGEMRFQGDRVCVTLETQTSEIQQAATAPKGLMLRYQRLCQLPLDCVERCLTRAYSIFGMIRG